MSEYIGMVFDLNSGELRLIIDPDYDYQLDDPAHVTCEGDNRLMVKVARNTLPDWVQKMGLPGCAYLHENAKTFLEAAV